MNSKEYSFKFVTVSQVVSKVGCELCCLNLEPSDVNANVNIFNGEDTAGEKIIGLFTSVKINQEFYPCVPIYCRKGLYIEIVAATTGIFVHWRELPSEKG